MSYKISVIIPVYNVETYLHKCISSVVNQTLNDIEIILVNDGSTDNSANIINEFSSKYKNIKVINKKNGGLSDARNIGIKNAEGEYIAFVDGDDSIEKEMFEEMYALGKQYSADIIICNLKNMNEKNEVIRFFPKMKGIEEKINLNTDFSLFGEISWFACNKVFKKELFDKIEFPKKMQFEDIATIPRLFLKSKIIAKTDKYFYNYLVRPGSITRNYSEKGLDILKAIDIVKQDYFNSKFKKEILEWRKFIIFQGFYSFLAYYAYIKDKNIKLNMFKELRLLIKSNHISKVDIITYSRYSKWYLSSLNLKKNIFYLLQLIKL